MTIYPYTWVIRFEDGRYSVSSSPGLENLGDVNWGTVDSLCLAPTEQGWPPVVLPVNSSFLKVSAEREVGTHREVRTVAVTIETRSLRYWLLPSGRIVTSPSTGTYESVLSDIA